MTIDATGKEIVIGTQYGYSKSSCGFTRVIIGTATKTNFAKVTLANIEEKEYMYVHEKTVSTPYKITNPKNSRTLSAVQVFPINS